MLYPLTNYVYLTTYASMISKITTLQYRRDGTLLIYHGKENLLLYVHNDLNTTCIQLSSNWGSLFISTAFAPPKEQ